MKNRFGAVSELGVFEMTGTGLRGVPNPSALFLAERPANAPDPPFSAVSKDLGPCLWRSIPRELLSFGNARRMASGIDRNRLSLLLAVLEKRAGLNLMGEDSSSTSPAACRSRNRPQTSRSSRLSPRACVTGRSKRHGVFGEVGLAGEVRGTTQSSLRVREAAKMGFTRCVLPPGSARPRDPPGGIELVDVRSVSEALDALMDW